MALEAAMLEMLYACKEELDLILNQYWPEGRKAEDLSDTRLLALRLDALIAKVERI